MDNIFTFHFTDYLLKQKTSNPFFIHIVKDFTLDVRERCDRIRAVKNG